jgi:hypothetical protein
MALMNSGFANEEPAELTVPLEKLIRVGFGVGRDDPVEKIYVELDEPIEEDEIDMGSDEPEEIHQIFDDEL